MFYFSINFDGETILEPALDPAYDKIVLGLYHQSMRDSRSGRHLFQHIPAAGGKILAAGSSDWVVYPGHEGYPADEAYFLHFIIHTIYQELREHPELEPSRFAQWTRYRQAQIDQGELVYIAHQLDFLGEMAASVTDARAGAGDGWASRL